jgi:hypothetical protein
MERLYFRSFFLNFSGQSDTASARLPPSPQPRRRGRRGRRASGRYLIQPAVQPQAAGHGLDNLVRPPHPAHHLGAVLRTRVVERNEANLLRRLLLPNALLSRSQIYVTV